MLYRISKEPEKLVLALMALLVVKLYGHRYLTTVEGDQTESAVILLAFRLVAKLVQFSIGGELEGTMNDVESRVCLAFKELAERQPIESIGIQAVCDRAEVSRRTFSRHFGAIQAVVERQIEADFIKPVVDVNKLIPAKSLADMALITRNLCVLQQNRAYYDAVIKEYGALWFADRLATGAVSMEFRPYDNLSLKPNELDFVENLFASSVASVFCWWIRRGMDVPPEDVARMIDDWLYAHFRELKVH